jgi:hypothetical protein
MISQMAGFGNTPQERIAWSVREYQADRTDLSSLMGNLNSQLAELTNEPWQNEFWDLCMLIEEVFSAHITFADPAGRPSAVPELDYEGAVMIQQAIERILSLVEDDSTSTED